MSGLSSYLLSTLSKVGGIGGSGIPDFHFTIGDKVEQDTGNSIWEQHNSLSTNGKREATVFVYNKARGSSYTAVAQNALKRMRTLRHPGILRYLDGAETADAIYIATERVTPLSLSLDSDGCDDELKRWGLYKIVETLRFVNEDCKLVHANVSTASVFVTKAGEWRLGGLELVDVLSGDPSCSQIYRHYTAAIPGYAAHMSPEIQSLSWGSVEDGKLGAIDGWGLACLIYQVYNGTLTSAAQLHAQGTIPKALWPMYQRMLVTDLRRRLTPSELLQSALRPHSFFDSEFIRTSIFLENIAVKEEDEKAKFFSGLASVIEGFPHIYCKFKILPELLKLMEFGGGGAKVLSSIIQIGKGLNEEEYNEHVSPAIVQLFGSNDRALRFSLLEHIGSFIAAIPTSVVSKKVFPDFVTGFMDAAPAIREATVKASLTIAPKLGQKVLNNDLVKQLVRMIADPEPGIRTNALICIGKLCTAKKGVLDLEDGGVSESSQRYVICPALLQALRDPFPPVRSASLAVANACAAKWDPVDIARRVIPTISLLLVDGEKPVRVAALKAINAMVARVETHSQDMPDTAMKKVASTPSNIATAASASSAGGKQSDIVSAPGSSTAASMNAQTEAAANMAAASDGWSGWAVSSLSNTISGALSLASSLPISQQQQQTSLDIQAESAGTGGTSVNPVNSKPFSTVAAASAAPKVNDTSSGWEFNDDDWEGNTGNAWDEDDDWDTEISTPNNQPTAISPTSPNTRGPSSGRKSGGMTMTSTIKPSAAIPSTPPQAPVTKTPLKLSKPALKKPGLSGSNTTTTTTTTPPTGTQRRKGLGAMKLGGGSKSPALPDDLF